jgi:hypothetical protein
MSKLFPYKKDIKNNQSAMWQVEVGPHGDGCTMILLSKFFFPSLSNFSYKLTFTNMLPLYEVTQFYKISENDFYNEVTV